MSSAERVRAPLSQQWEGTTRTPRVAGGRWPWGRREATEDRGGWTLGQRGKHSNRYSGSEDPEQNQRTGQPFKVIHTEGTNEVEERERRDGRKEVRLLPRRAAEMAQGDRGVEKGGSDSGTSSQDHPRAGAPQAPSGCRMNQEDVCEGAVWQGKANELNTLKRANTMSVVEYMKYALKTQNFSKYSPNIHTSLAEVKRRKLMDSGAIHLMGNFPLEARRLILESEFSLLSAQGSNSYS